MPLICPWSSTLSRALSIADTRAARLSFAPSNSIPVKESASVERSSPFEDSVALSTAPCTNAPAGMTNAPLSMTGAITTASTGSLALAVFVETFVVRRI